MRYDDIIDLPHHTSERHPRMARADRAAQFAPFSALSGYEEAIGEAERLTRRNIELGEDAVERLDRWHKVLAAIADTNPRLRISYFIPDDRKKRGGSYATIDTRLVKFSSEDRILTLEGGVRVPLEEIKTITSDLFAPLFEGGFD